MKLESLVVEASELDGTAYQDKLLKTRNTYAIFKHLKCFSKSSKLIITEYQSTILLHKNVKLLNKFFHSVFSHMKMFSINDVK